MEKYSRGKTGTDKTMAIFESIPIRRVWDSKKEQWYFAVVDVVKVLSDSKNPAVYWRVMKKRLIDEGSGETVTKCNGLKMRALDGKIRETDVADTETLFRLVQSIPSPKAEPFKQWLARVGYERLQETVNPELSVDRARGHWKQAGRSEKWVEQRMRSQETRSKLTDYWHESGVAQGVEYAKLTDIIHQEWSGLTTQQHKMVKGLRGENLRDNMTEAELIFTALAELSTTQIAKSEEAKGYAQNANVAQKGGKIAGNARSALEAQTGKKFVSAENFLPPSKRQERI